MLHLASETDRGWVGRVSADLPTLLLDHAHCEKKAAGTAIGLLFRYPDQTALLAPLSRLAREELSHFEEVLDVLQRRGIAFTRLAPSPYAGELTSIVRAAEPLRLLDTLLCCALIEARSCERMQLLADRLADEELARFYRGLLAAEARHHQIYVDLARETGLFTEVQIRARLAEIAAHEADVLSKTHAEPRMHG